MRREVVMAYRITKMLKQIRAHDKTIVSVRDIDEAEVMRSLFGDKPNADLCHKIYYTLCDAYNGDDNVGKNGWITLLTLTSLLPTMGTLRIIWQRV